jgi:hypothetical protein
VLIPSCGCSAFKLLTARLAIAVVGPSKTIYLRCHFYHSARLQFAILAVFQTEMLNDGPLVYRQALEMRRVWIAAVMIAVAAFVFVVPVVPTQVSREQLYCSGSFPCKLVVQRIGTSDAEKYIQAHPYILYWSLSAYVSQTVGIVCSPNIGFPAPGNESLACWLLG